VIAARLAFVIRYPQAFAGNPLDIFSRNLGLFDPLAGVVVAILAASIYAQKTGLPLWPTLDALTPAMAVFALALSLSHLASGAAFGAPADLPWSLELWGARRHPSQIYEAIVASLTLLFLWPTKKFLMDLRTGSYFFYFLALTSAAGLFLEAFRGDSALLPGGLRTVQLAYWIILSICLYATHRINPQTKQA
jgi:prolipoprotein diacylglyceryltransferase